MTKTLRKPVTMLLALCMVFSLAVGACADDITASGGSATSPVNLTTTNDGIGGGYAPGDKLHRTCRQIGNLKGREQRELADDHPVKQIYEKRLNTINRYVKRGTLDADLAEVMKKLAKDKMLRALSNVAYAKGDYEKEMGQAALKKEAKLRTK